MPDSDSQRVKEIFAAAIGLSGSAREKVLRTACGSDRPLRERVEALLAQDVEASAELYLEQAPAWPARDTLPGSRSDDDRIGSQIGPYRIERILGRGGMGEVYLASRTEPYQQQVAIKLLKRGLDTSEILGRFQNEVQFLAAVGRHPHIVGLSDAAMTDDGLPYFVMEYVAGTTIDRYCQQQQLDTEQTLRMFVTVCHAVQFAHQNTVLHRDLKPSNILVTRDGEPRLIDFGIAKLTQSGPEQPTVAHTRPGEGVMTPEYASPEQVRGEPLTTTSDVYSLGVVLYELLTGQRPYQFDSRQPHEIVDVICNQTPAKPSTAVSRAATSAKGVAAETSAVQDSETTSDSRNRPSRVRRRLRGDIDNIVLKALHKESERRYESVSQFAADIERHLRGLPVAARPDTLGYRISKFVMRNKLAATAAGAVAFAIIIGSITTGLAWRRAEAEAERARQQAARSEASLQLARQTIFDFMVEASQSTGILAEAPGTQRIRARLFANAARQFGTIIDEIGDSPGDRAELAKALFWLGYIQTDLGQHAEAEQSYMRSIAEWDRVLAAEPDSVAHDAERAQTYNNLGLLLTSYEDPQRQAEGEHFIRRAIESRQRLLTQDPENRDLLAALARSYLNLGRRLRNLEQPEDAELAYTSAREINQKLLTIDPEHRGYRRAVAKDAMHVGMNRFLEDDFKSALTEFLEAAAILRDLYAEDALLYRGELAMSLYHAAWMHRLLKDYDASLTLYQEARQLVARLVAENPNVSKHREDLALIYNGIATVYISRHEYATAIEPLESAVQLGEQLIAASPELLVHKRTTLQARHNLAVAYSNMGRFEEAVLANRQVVAELESMIERQPTNENRLNLLASLSSMAGHLTQLGRRDEAASAYAQAIEGLEQLSAGNPGVLRFQLMLGGAYCNLGNFLREGGAYADSLDLYRRASDTLIPIDGKHPVVATFLRHTNNGRGLSLERLKRYPEALASFDRALELENDPMRADVEVARARTIAKSGRYTEAIAAAEATITSRADDESVKLYATPVFVVAAGQVLEDGSLELAERQAASDAYLDRAMELVRASDNEDYLRGSPSRIEWLKTDPDLELLRAREEFHAFAASLESNLAR